MDDNADGASRLRDLARDCEAGVKRKRQEGDIAALLAAAAAAVDTLEAALAAAPDAAEDERVDVLKTVKRIGYNSAADVFPGWAVDTPARSESELAAARALAVRSGGIVDRLAQPPMQRGNAIWLIGALDLARGQRAAAVTAFRKAADFYADAPEMQLMAEGYLAIADRSGGFDGVMARLEDLKSEDADAMREQLVVARAVFD